VQAATMRRVTRCGLGIFATGGLAPRKILICDLPKFIG
jgi:hypothetical protein